MDRYILVASSFPDFRDFLAQSAALALPEALVVPAESYEQLVQHLPTLPPGSVIVTDVVWDEANYGDAIIALATAYPSFTWGIASPVDLYGIVTLYYPMPMLSQPQDAEIIISLIRFLAEDLRTLSISGFTLLEFAGQSRLGRCYLGHQPAIHRDVMITLGYPDPSPEEISYFLETASAQARLSHPSIYSIYESGEENGRSFVAQEPVLVPTLFALQTKKIVLPARMIARLLHTMVSVLGYLKQSGLPHHPIGPHDVTFAQNGVVKVINVGCTESLDQLPESEEMARFANILLPFVPSQFSDFDPELLGLLAAMQRGQTNLEQVREVSASIDLKLAPVKEVPKRKQTIEAEKAVLYARKKFWILTGVGTVLFAIFSIFLVLKIIYFFFPVPGKPFKNQLEIPAGKVLVGKKEIEVPRFFMDEYETTVGQYEKFLKENEGKDIKALLPPGSNLTLKDLLPLEWDKVMGSIKSRKSYLGTTFTKDCPVLNVTFDGAYAYAKWRGKRLPTELEWLRAASGDEQLPYPWGKDPEIKYANTGSDVNPVQGTAAGSIDGFRGPSPVDDILRDVSPFRVGNMAGNVSEWVVGSPEIGPIKADNQVFKGGNFDQPKLILNQQRFFVPARNTLNFLGFRCASDQKVN